MGTAVKVLVRILSWVYQTLGPVATTIVVVASAATALGLVWWVTASSPRRKDIADVREHDAPYEGILDQLDARDRAEAAIPNSRPLD